MTKTREPVEGDFPLLMIHKRGPKSLISVIRTFTDIDTFSKKLSLHAQLKKFAREQDASHRVCIGICIGEAS